MKAETENQPAAPSKTLLSDEIDADVVLMKLTLDRVGRSTHGMDAEQIGTAYAQWQRDQDNAIEVERKTEQDRQQALLEKAKADGLVARERRVKSECERLEIDTTGMTLEQMIEVGRAAWHKEQEQKEAGRCRARAERLFSDALVPDRHSEHLDSEGGNAQWLETRDTIIKGIELGDGCLVALLGKRGTGKTQIAVSVIHRSCGDGKSCRYVKAMDLFREVRKAFASRARGESGVTESDIVDELAGFDVLVIDECHQRGETDWEQNTLINLLDRRYDAKKCTILISNQTKDEFGAAMGDSVKSRIHETGHVFECNWESYRKPGSWLARVATA